MEQTSETVRFRGTRKLGVGLLALAAMAGCTSAPSDTPAPRGAVAPAAASTVDGPFTLTLEFPADTWQSGTAITGKATLAYAGPGGAMLMGSGGGVIAMSVAEVHGTRHLDGTVTADCGPHPISDASPIVTGLLKSGAWTGDDANAAFYQGFLADKEYKLPAGDWDITAWASFGVGACGPTHDLKATVRLHIRS